MHSIPAKTVAEKLVRRGQIGISEILCTHISPTYSQGGPHMPARHLHAYGALRNVPPFEVSVRFPFPMSTEHTK